MSVCAPPAAASASLRRAALPRRARCRASRLACAVASALPPPTAAGAVARAALLQRIATAPDRGVFGLPDAERGAIDALVRALEAHTPVEAPTAALEALSGDWRLLYTTVTIRGSKRTKLGLRGMVSLGAFTQRIDADSGRATNVVGFALAGGGAFRGALTIDAGFAVASPKRVDITYESSRLEPRQLQAIFEATLPLLLEVFNPQGWLELTYVDEALRVGRDDKGHTFVLERAARDEAADAALADA